MNLNLEELMKIQITTADRRQQKLNQVPAAVFVITQDDIRRSGATSIPDALRMAPEVQVDRIGTDNWSISIRGFNGRFANKLQVLIDGRSVYNPLFSGTIWDQQDTLMEDCNGQQKPGTYSGSIVKKIPLEFDWGHVVYSRV